MATTLKQLRLEKGWTQEELAQRINLDSSTVSNYERGHRRPPYETLHLIAQVFDITMAQAHSLFLRPHPHLEGKKR
jgi:transcriptional regulator with XRE-family HTH domain